MPDTRERGIARRRIEPGGAYQRSSLSSTTYFSSGSSAVKILYLSQQVRVFALLLHEFLRFAKQACDPLQHGWVWALVFVLTKGRVCRRGGHLGGERWASLSWCFCFLVWARDSGVTGGGGDNISPGGTIGESGLDCWSGGEWPG